MKRIIFLLVVLSFSQTLLAQIVDYDFSAVSPSGHTLFYKYHYSDEITSVIVCPPTKYNAYEEPWEFNPYPSSFGYVFPAPTGSLIIPDTVSWGGITYNVVGIDAYAFSKCTLLSSVTLPSNLTFIGMYAFYNCISLSSIVLPNSIVNIGQAAFQNCTSLTTISLPNSLFLINTKIFQGCSALSSVTMPQTITYGYLGSDAFKNCSSLTSIIIPQGITTIASGAFQSCTSLNTVSLPLSLSEIGANAFSYCSSITDITIPDSVTTIRSEAFRYCSSLKKVILGKKINIIENYAFANNANYDTIRFRRSEVSSYWTCSQYCFRHTSENRQIRFEVPCGMVSFYRQAIYNDNSTSLPVYEVNINKLSVFSNNNTHGFASITHPATCNSAAIVLATPNNGYHFTHWNDGDINNPRSINVTQDTTFTAFFEANMCQINVSSNNPLYGYVTGGGTFMYHDTIVIHAFPNEHYHFLHWNDGTSNNPRQYIINGDANLVAIFAVDTHLVTVSSNNISYGNTTGGGAFPYGTATSVSASAYTGYQFVQWSDGVTENPYTFAVLSDILLTAIFLPAYTINVESANPSMGSVAGGGQYVEGTACSLTAIPNTGFQFDRWQDGNTENPRSFTVTSNATYIAYFVSSNGIESFSEEDISIYLQDGRIVVNGTSDIVQIFDMTGRNVRNKELPAGVYFVKIGNHFAQKVVVVR